MKIASFPEGLMSPEMEFAEGGVILDSRTRFADLKAMLDGSKDGVKVDAMKRIINLVARGKDMAELFPAVVKNVAAKNLELKKLVYVYLERYAEEQQDLALLSISTFQRALKDPNQLIRASALRVLSGIRVPMVAPIVLLAIKDSVRDMSPYVRKVAAHAIPKLYALDSGLEEELVECICLLLQDRRGLVLGSAVYALEQISPSNFPLIHAHFRAFCKSLADIDEWGQVVMLNLLTRYARSQLPAPDIEPLDSDLALLIASARPLLQSRNCAVVLAVASLMAHSAPPSMLPVASSALVRLLRGPREVQYVVLLNVASLCERQRLEQPGLPISHTMFDPFLKSFFLRSTDSSGVRELKLHILTCLVSEANVYIILRELRTYVNWRELAGGAVEAIGRCALRVKSVSESCLAGLFQLLASSDDAVVSATVLVLKRLLHADAPVPLLARLSRLVTKLKVPEAKACVVWLVSTHIRKALDLAPDLLRIFAKNFPNEHEFVKLEALKLAVCLWILKREECASLVHFVLQLARFDLSYDIRDRCRFVRNLLFSTTLLSSKAEELFLSAKPTPSLSSSFSERHDFQLGSLSHALNQRCARYTDLPPWTENPSDPSLRGEPDKLSLEDEEEDEEDEEEEEDEDEEDEDEDEEDEEDEDEDESDEEEDEESDEEEEEESEEEQPPPVKQPVNNQKKTKPTAVEAEKNVKTTPSPEKKARNAIDLLLDLDFSPAGLRAVMPAALPSSLGSELQSGVQADGLSLSLDFPRLSNSSFTLLRFTFANSSSRPVDSIRLVPPAGCRVEGETMVEKLEPGEIVTRDVWVDVGDCGGGRKWGVEAEGRPTKNLQIDVPLGEQIEAVRLDDSDAEKERQRLTGMNRILKKTRNKPTSDAILPIANLHPSTSQLLTGQTRSGKDLVLVRLSENEVEVSSDNALFASSLAFALQSHIDGSN